MKTFLTILLCCFTLVSVAQTAPVPGTVRHDAGIAAATVQPAATLASFVKVEEVIEIEDLLTPAFTLAIADDFRLRAPALPIPTDDVGGLSNAATPLYLAIRTLLI